jgi:hypothetical protein
MFATRRQSAHLVRKFSQAQVVAETHYYPDHCKPHSPPPSQPFRDNKIDDTPSEAAKVIYGDNDPQEAIIWMTHSSEKVFILDDTAKYSLIVT